MLKHDKTIGLIGVGLIGSAMAERLITGGYIVIGWDLEADCLANLLALGGRAAPDVQTIFRQCNVVFFSLPSHHEVNQVLEACDADLQPGLTIIDTTTGDPVSTEQVAEKLAARGLSYLDATISGNSAQVRTGAVALMVGGARDTFDDCSDLFAAIGRQTFYTGPAGTGAKMKLVTNLVLGLNRAALAEGLAFAQSFGLDLSRTLEVMRGGGAYSRIMDTKGERMINHDFTPDARLSQHLKDVRLIVSIGQQAGLPMPLSATHRTILEQAEAAGCGELDNSAIITVLSAAQAIGSKS
jgi:3-hydroxyisobutyrate dehydrogenase-like beta-hydroxyacid dehydrogenase